MCGSQAMSVDQLSHLSLSAINALTYAQRSSLDREQMKAIQGTARTLGSVLASDGCIVHANCWLTFTVQMVHLMWSTVAMMMMITIDNINTYYNIV